MTIEIKRSDLYSAKGHVDPSNIVKTEEGFASSEELDKILAEILTHKYAGGANENVD